MNHLQKLATAIRNANEFIAASKSKNNLPRKVKNSPYTSSKDTSPTSEEKDKHEAGIAYDAPIDLSIEPSIEYLR